MLCYLCVINPGPLPTPEMGHMRHGSKIHHTRTHVTFTNWWGQGPDPARMGNFESSCFDAVSDLTDFAMHDLLATLRAAGNPASAILLERD